MKASEFKKNNKGCKELTNENEQFEFVDVRKTDENNVFVGVFSRIETNQFGAIVVCKDNKAFQMCGNLTQAFENVKKGTEFCLYHLEVKTTNSGRDFHKFVVLANEDENEII